MGMTRTLPTASTRGPRAEATRIWLMYTCRNRCWCERSEIRITVALVIYLSTISHLSESYKQLKHGQMFTETSKVFLLYKHLVIAEGKTGFTLKILEQYKKEDPLGRTRWRSQYQILCGSFQDCAGCTGRRRTTDIRTTSCNQNIRKIYKDLLF